MDIAELLEASRRYKLAYSSLNSLISYFDGSFLRVSETTLMSIEALNITEEDIALIRCHARDQYAASGYRALNNIKDYTSYPDLGLQWNLFLLRSLLQRYDDDIVMADIPSSDSYQMATIIIDPALKIDTYERLAEYAARKRHSVKPFTSLAELTEWFKSEGLIISKIPAAIQNSPWLKEILS